MIGIRVIAHEIFVIDKVLEDIDNVVSRIVVLAIGNIDASISGINLRNNIDCGASLGSLDGDGVERVSVFVDRCENSDGGGVAV